MAAVPMDPRVPKIRIKTRQLAQVTKQLNEKTLMSCDTSLTYIFSGALLVSTAVSYLIFRVFAFFCLLEDTLALLCLNVRAWMKYRMYFVCIFTPLVRTSRQLLLCRDALVRTHAPEQA